MTREYMLIVMLTISAKSFESFATDEKCKLQLWGAEFSS
jgi:hypothetical protein